jgi:MFS family permease
MRVQVKFQPLRQVKWQEVAIRFVFGGAITVIAGLLAKGYGPSIGGLFLAFPAIFPAGVTLLAQKQKEKKRKKGMNGQLRGTKAAAVEARGTTVGTIGLGCFAGVVATTLQNWNSVLVLLAAMAAWLAVSGGLWELNRKVRHWRTRRKARGGQKIEVEEEPERPAEKPGESHWDQR